MPATKSQQARLKLDRIDVRILAILHRQGGLTNLKLADLVGLSPSPCLQRVKRLEKAGYIRGYGAVLDINRLCDWVKVYAEITLADHRAADFAKFEKAVQDIPEIVECSLVSGDYDYLVKFVVRSIDHFHEVTAHMLASDLGIHRHFTYIAIKTVKQSDHWPLEVLMDSSDSDESAER